jgi:arylsulfatase
MTLMQCVRSLWFVVVACWISSSHATQAVTPPNVIVILADDMGFSDAGCYGGEIDTPNLDRLAHNGLRFTQGYNTARCWPTRGAILTGYYAQSIRRDSSPGINGGGRGKRPAWAKLLPERLVSAGYRSYHSGKWHIDGDPRQQGFQHSLQIEGGQNDFFDPKGISVDGEPIGETKDFYVTTEVGAHAVECLRQHALNHADQPFFSYVAFTSPHFPLHAPQDVIAKYKDRYLAGWDVLRQARYQRLVERGMIQADLSALEPDVGPPYDFPEAIKQLGAGEVNRPLPWKKLSSRQKDFQATKMAIHAAMIEMMDRAIGNIVSQLEVMGAMENTLILALSDNGASAEIMVRGKGHDSALPPGSQGTYLCLGPGFSSCANTPFRRHKTWVHEGGIATSWIAHWPGGISSKSALRTQPVHVIDIAPTVLELAGVQDISSVGDGNVPHPMQGKSFAQCLTNPVATPPHESLWWCHGGHRAVRHGDWKLVAAKDEPWELYDLSHDRTETHDLAAVHPHTVATLEQKWNAINNECMQLAASDGQLSQAAKKRPAKRKKDSGKGSLDTRAGRAVTDQKQTNVVIIFADDMGYGDPACFGGTYAATPHIDRLAREGIRMTDFHVAQPVCSASRAALLTGCYPNRLGIHGALGPKSLHGLAASETTLAELLKERGYRTGIVGKWHLGHHAQFLPIHHGFDEYFGLPYSNDMWPHHPQAKPGTYPPLPLVENDKIIDAEVTPADQETLTQRYTERAVKFIEKAGNAANGQPFFLYLAHSMPHVPLFASQDFQGKNPGGLYGDVISEIDASVGAVMEALEKTGHINDTLILFTSDNGPWLSYGNHAGTAGLLREGKGTTFEGGVRVPFVARLPGRIPAGTVSDEPLMTIDILPSIARLTGKPLAEDKTGSCRLHGKRIDGHDRLDILFGKNRRASDSDVYLFYYKVNELQAVREGQWKLFFPHGYRTMKGQVVGKDGIPGRYTQEKIKKVLFDLKKDPGETQDISKDHPDIVKRLEQIAQQARTDLGDKLKDQKGNGLREPDRLSLQSSSAK